MVHWSSHATASLSLVAGGLSLRNAVKLKYAAHWANCADSFEDDPRSSPRDRPHHLDAIHDECDGDNIPTLLSNAANVRDASFTLPPWEDLAATTTEEEPKHGEMEPNQPRQGWQSRAVRDMEFRNLLAIREALPNPPQALFRSQRAPLASVPFVCMPVDRVFRIDSQPFKILFWRRLRMPLSLPVHSCRCGRLLDNLNHRRSTCAIAGVLGKRGFPLENATARICREAGGRMRTNIFVRDLDLHPTNNLDARRLEIVVDGLSLFRAQLANNTTQVSHLSRNGTARPRCATVNGTALERARIKKKRRYPELVGNHGGARLVGLAGEIGGLVFQ